MKASHKSTHKVQSKMQGKNLEETDTMAAGHSKLGINIWEIPDSEGLFGTERSSLSGSATNVSNLLKWLHLSPDNPIATAA